MSKGDADRVRRTVIACLFACIATIGDSGSLLAQSPSPPGASSAPVEGAGLELFPSAEEISEVLDVDVEARGIQDDLSNLWEGTDIDWDAMVSARTQSYAPPQAETQDPLTGVLIDVVHFQGLDEAAQHGDDVAAAVTNGLPGFATDLSGDLVATASFTSDDGFGGSVIVVRDGLVVVVVTTFATGADEMETVSEAVVGLVLGRLHGDN
jgi:hypothetical protein